MEGSVKLYESSYNINTVSFFKLLTVRSKKKIVRMEIFKIKLI